MIRADTNVHSQYLAELLAERQKLVPFMQVLPICSRLLNQEILRVSRMISGQGIGGKDNLLRGRLSAMEAPDIIQNIGGKDFGGWKGNDLYSPQSEWCGGRAEMPINWQPGARSPSSFVIKKAMCIEIPVDMYPNFNFVGRLLGPRGNSLKRVEASTGCRVFIRGKGSIKDPDKEEILRGRPGYEHLTDPLHIMIEAEFPANVVDVRLEQAKEIIAELLTPVDESQDFYKKQQLRELAMLNNGFREDSPQPQGSQSPFNSSGLKRAKTAGW